MTPPSAGEALSSLAFSILLGCLAASAPSEPPGEIRPTTRFRGRNLDETQMEGRIGGLGRPHNARARAAAPSPGRFELFEADDVVGRPEDGPGLYPSGPR